MLFGVDYGLIYWSEQFIDSGLTAMLFATLPLITIVAAHLYLPGEPITRAQASAERCSRSSASWRCSAITCGSIRSRRSPMAAVVAGDAFAAAAGGVAAKRHGAALHPAALNAPAMLVGAAALAAASLATGDGFTLPRDRQAMGAIAYLAVAGSVVSFLAYFSSVEDVERDQPELHQRVHAGHRAGPRLRVPRRASDAC